MTEQAAEIHEAAATQRRRNVASALMILLVGIGLLGVAMIAAAMIWAAKLRRLARAPGAGPTRPDELWYLKTPPPTKDDGSQHPPPLPADDPTLPTTDGETGR